MQTQAFALSGRPVGDTLPSLTADRVPSRVCVLRLSISHCVKARKKTSWAREILDESLQAPASGSRHLLQLDRALDDLARMNPRQAVMVESRFFGGLDVPEIANLLSVSEATVLRDWRAAKAWLAHELQRA